MDNFAASFDVECPIHMGTMDNPKLLPCGHEFCASCLAFIRARNRGTVICPTCKFAMKLDTLEDLPNVNNGTTNSAMEKQNGMPEEVGQTLTSLHSIEKSCEETVEKLEQMIAELLNIKASTERKRHSVEDIVFEKNNKRGMSSTEICNFVQKSTQMLQNELFLQLNNHLPKFMSAIDVYKVMEIPNIRAHSDLTDKTEDIFKFASSLFLQLPTGEYTVLANSLAHYLQNSLQEEDGHIWTVVAGEKGYWASHSDYLSMDLGGTLIAACQCTMSGQIPINKEEMNKFLLENCTESLIQWKKGLCSNPTLYVTKQLSAETNLEWHCIAGDKGKVCLDTGKPLVSQYSVCVGDLCFTVWQS